MSYTGSSCEHIFSKYPEIYKSIPTPGYYHLSDNTWTYCNMTKIAVDGGFASTCTGIEIVKFTYQCFLPDNSCESIYNNNVEGHEWSGYYWITKRIYCGMRHTGSSCVDIYKSHPDTRTKSGYYRTSNNQWTYCNMTEIHDNFTYIHQHVLVLEEDG